MKDSFAFEKIGCVIVCENGFVCVCQIERHGAVVYVREKRWCGFVCKRERDGAAVCIRERDGAGMCIRERDGAGVYVRERERWCGCVYKRQ